MHDRTTILTGLFAVSFGAIALLLWIPADVRTGIVETARRRVVIGDAMAPTAYAVGIVLVGLLLCVSAVRHAPGAPVTAGLDRGNVLWVSMVAAILAVSLVVMVFAGPLFVDVANASGWEARSYRQLIDMAPYKYISFALGGFLMVFGLTSLIARRASWRLAAVSAVSVAVMIALYDLPFDDLLLPPNGDQ